MYIKLNDYLETLIPGSFVNIKTPDSYIYIGLASKFFETKFSEENFNLIKSEGRHGEYRIEVSKG